MAASSGRMAFGAKFCAERLSRKPASSTTTTQATRSCVRMFQPYQKKGRSPVRRSGQPINRRDVRLVARAGARRLLHALGDDSDLIHTGAFRRVDHVDDVLVAEGARCHQEDLLVLALVVDIA